MSEKLWESFIKSDVRDIYLDGQIFTDLNSKRFFDWIVDWICSLFLMNKLLHFTFPAKHFIFVFTKYTSTFFSETKQSSVLLNASPEQISFLLTHQSALNCILWSRMKRLFSVTDFICLWSLSLPFWFSEHASHVHFVFTVFPWLFSRTPNPRLA